ncbi:uncharacterized protein LOC116255591 [Nymphaea colorata]|nr:uncharacterized protein LOC116255591 [Nymphaea colorata]
MADSLLHSPFLLNHRRSSSQVPPLELNSLLFHGLEAAKKSWGLPTRVRRSLSVKNAVSASNESWNLNLSRTRPCLSDIVWPSAGAFAAMAIMGRVDQMIAVKGLALTTPPFGAVCMVLLATPTAPAAKKYNMFVSQICCAAIGVLAFVIFGAGWVARSTALAASIAFMIYTGYTHPPAASLPLMFIDGAKYHNLQLWYALFPGATGCILLCLIQEIVCYLKENYKF